MATQIEILNLALNYIGQRSISSITENTETARKCAILWQPSLDFVLRAHQWNFAKRQEALALLTETLLNWDYVYAYPSNALYIRRVFSAETINKDDREEYEELSTSGNIKVIATDIEDAYVEYTAKITDLSICDSQFINALAAYIASMLAKPLTGDDNLTSKMYQTFSVVVDQAKFTNSSQVNIISTALSPYEEAR